MKFGSYAIPFKGSGISEITSLNGIPLAIASSRSLPDVHKRYDPVHKILDSWEIRRQDLWF